MTATLSVWARTGCDLCQFAVWLCLAVVTGKAAWLFWGKLDLIFREVAK